MMKVVPPRRRLPGSFVMKPRCANDVPVNERPPPSHASPTSVCVMNASCRLQYSAPLGKPVVPEVKMIATGRSGSSGSGGGAPARHAEVGEHARRGESAARGLDHELRIGDVEHGGSLACRQAVVHARGDRADLRRGAVREEVLGPRRQDERDHVAGADTARGETGRDFVGDAIDVGVGDRSSRLR